MLVSDVYLISSINSINLAIELKNFRKIKKDWDLEKERKKERKFLKVN